jgi:hypothetical protein
MDGEKIKEMLGAFISGLEKEDLSDINNGVFIGNELLHLGLPVKFNGAYRSGVESLQICGLLRLIEPNHADNRAYEIGKRLSTYNSKELALMSLYLWNDGRSTLYNDERERAREFLRQEFGYPPK